MAEKQSSGLRFRLRKGKRPCKSCGRPHYERRRGDTQWTTWDDPEDEHNYEPMTPLQQELENAEDAVLKAWLTTGRHELWLALKTLVCLRDRLESSQEGRDDG